MGQKDFSIDDLELAIIHEVVPGRPTSNWSHRQSSRPGAGAGAPSGFLILKQRHQLGVQRFHALRAAACGYQAPAPVRAAIGGNVVRRTRRALCAAL